MVIQAKDNETGRRATYLCGEAGHCRIDYPKNAHQNLLKSKHTVKSACFRYVLSKLTIQTHNQNVWIVDSGASNHMTQRKEL